MNVDWFQARLRRHAYERPRHVALQSNRESVLYRDLIPWIDQFDQWLDDLGGRHVGLLCANALDAVGIDLASLLGGGTLIPIPPFFSDSQLSHVITTGEVDAIVTDDPDRVHSLYPHAEARPFGAHGLTALLLPVGDHRLGAGKVTFTSGTTGTPKGACVPSHAQLTVATSLAHATKASPSDRHLSLLPLSVLLETIGGVYQTLIAGGTLLLPHESETGADGATRIDAALLLDTLRRNDATMSVFMPQFLNDVVDALDRGGVSRPQSLRFIGVGGAYVSHQLLERAAQLDLPVFQGYGLTEASSVVALNLPGQNRLGSVGQVLPHVDLKIDASGELSVRGSTFSHYIGTSGQPNEDGFWRTGDLGRLDEAGYLYLEGRVHDVLCTSFGRNVSRGWLEGLLTGHHEILAARIDGDGLPGPTAQLVCRGGIGVAERIVTDVNSKLPGYARIRSFAIYDSLPHHHHTPPSLRSSNALL